MNESDYHRLANSWLDALMDGLEEADSQGVIELERSAGVVTIVSASHKTWVVSKHAPSQQLWLSSPLSGGLHFTHDGAQWRLNDGKALGNVLAEELKQLAGIEAVIP